jgi:hypothetical protein
VKEDVFRFLDKKVRCAKVVRGQHRLLSEKWCKKSGPGAAIRKRIVRAVEANREKLMEEWRRKVNVKTPGARR